jgi:hypothetical protein
MQVSGSRRHVWHGRVGHRERGPLSPQRVPSSLNQQLLNLRETTRLSVDVDVVGQGRGV